MHRALTRGGVYFVPPSPKMTRRPCPWGKTCNRNTCPNDHEPVWAPGECYKSGIWPACTYGVQCRVPSCGYAHPAEWSSRQLSTMACPAGSGCRSDVCLMKHPPAMGPEDTFKDRIWPVCQSGSYCQKRDCAMRHSGPDVCPKGHGCAQAGCALLHPQGWDSSRAHEVRCVHRHRCRWAQCPMVHPIQWDPAIQHKLQFCALHKAHRHPDCLRVKVGNKLGLRVCYPDSVCGTGEAHRHDRCPPCRGFAWCMSTDCPQVHPVIWSPVELFREGDGMCNLGKDCSDPRCPYDHPSS